MPMWIRTRTADLVAATARHSIIERCKVQCSCTASLWPAYSGRRDAGDTIIRRDDAQAADQPNAGIVAARRAPRHEFLREFGDEYASGQDRDGGRGGRAGASPRHAGPAALSVPLLSG